tara:strand:+ start:795 stop:899 length:105 start_codon:yes stop_codon:yes gene_type:complete
MTEFEGPVEATTGEIDVKIRMVTKVNDDVRRMNA